MTMGKATRRKLAEGNIFDWNISGIVERPIDEQIRAYIRIPDGYGYEKSEEMLL